MPFVPVVPTAPKARTFPLPRLETYTKTTMPDATLNEGIIIKLTNGGAADASCLAVSDGVNWWTIAVGAVIA